MEQGGLESTLHCQNATVHHTKQLILVLRSHSCLYMHVANFMVGAFLFKTF